MNPWLGSQTPDMIKLRNWLRTKREEMHALQPSDIPLVTAGFSARDRSVPVGGDTDSPSVYEEDFSGFGWIHDADIRGFLNLQLTSKPEQPGFLRLKPARIQDALTMMNHHVHNMATIRTAIAYDMTYPSFVIRAMHKPCLLGLLQYQKSLLPR